MPFIDWFNELEGYALRSERFYNTFSMGLTTPKMAETMVQWLQAAYESGLEAKESAAKPAKDAWRPDVCPITGLPFFMWIEHHESGQMVPTYGGPYDSYTIPVRDENGSFVRERYDHDNGWWVTDEVEDVGVMIVSDQSYVVDTIAEESWLETPDEKRAYAWGYMKAKEEPRGKVPEADICFRDLFEAAKRVGVLQEQRIMALEKANKNLTVRSFDLADIDKYPQGTVDDIIESAANYTEDGKDYRIPFNLQYGQRLVAMVVAECIAQCNSVAQMASVTNVGEMARKTKTTAESCANMIGMRFGVGRQTPQDGAEDV